jgi:hypothetical protein
MVAAVILAAASGRTVDPQINSAPMGAGDLTLPDATRLAALRLAFFAACHDASVWLTGWYPETFAMQVAACNAPMSRATGAPGPHRCSRSSPTSTRFTSATNGTICAPLRRPCHDHGHRRRRHALFPEQPHAVAAAVIDYLRTSTHR